VKERGILFSGAMVRALLSGAKTQTRRVVSIREFGPSQTRGYDWTFRGRYGMWNDVSHARLMEQCPYGKPGDRLWVRETWRTMHANNHRAPSELHPDRTLVAYEADADRVIKGRLRPSLRMPRWASRITLEVTEVRVQRLQDISEEDARAEGVAPAPGLTFRPEGESDLRPLTHREAFECLWDSINGDRASWSSNPWVWAVSFRRLP
jgi:hypothetical protein